MLFVASACGAEGNAPTRIFAVPDAQPWHETDACTDLFSPPFPAETVQLHLSEVPEGRLEIEAEENGVHLAFHEGAPYDDWSFKYLSGPNAVRFTTYVPARNATITVQYPCGSAAGKDPK